MVGAAIVCQLEARKDAGEKLEILTRSHAELDLTEQVKVREFLMYLKKDYRHISIMQISLFFMLGFRIQCNYIDVLDTLLLLFGICYYSLNLRWRTADNFRDFVLDSLTLVYEI